MTSSVAIAVALFLLLNEVTLIYEGSLVNDKHFSSCITYIISICILIRKVQIVPKYFRSSSVEIALTTLLLEWSLIYVWSNIVNIVEANYDDGILEVSNTLQWLFCTLQRHNKELTFAGLVLRTLSFVILLTVCSLLEH